MSPVEGAADGDCAQSDVYKNPSFPAAFLHLSVCASTGRNRLNCIRDLSSLPRVDPGFEGDLQLPLCTHPRVQPGLGERSSGLVRREPEVDESGCVSYTLWFLHEIPLKGRGWGDSSARGNPCQGLPHSMSVAFYSRTMWIYTI